jgi:hypothetical protein
MCAAVVFIRGCFVETPGDAFAAKLLAACVPAGVGAGLYFALCLALRVPEAAGALRWVAGFARTKNTL